ncbi:hypothetical protein UWK_00651 [Desulfocapsa sulfexigens DSM 10523]|uniref:Endonuclease GajA/Old nuclease/RecF-like AAA domain-containing protein n=1 Tax=Desulfocapsa sulfexigens (strain DSM 10523 / SB164P1) TaxID=1167006 RepID=M1P6A2_DESSD|nr:AAA family ATPase [Desulfocapsa sulfexigens]AGF77232.1 hypothetical protein UWK_00651 [Desulfocapsa sulfexigens DSM 10523]
MDSVITIYDFKLLALTIDRIGPFQEKQFEIDFTDKNNNPCNFYLFVSRNGSGKTTIFETLTSLLGLLDNPSPTEFHQEDLDLNQGRAQLDIWLRLRWQGKEQAIVFSIVGGRIGEEFSFKVWDKETLEEYNAESWHRISYISQTSGSIKKPSPSSELVETLLAVIQAGKKSTPSDFGDSQIALPTVLYFSAYRDIPDITEEPHTKPNYSARSITQPKHWSYNASHRFEPHDQNWHGSLDNLLVWLKWLSDGRFKKACDLINSKVFAGTDKYLKDVRRDPPEAIVSCSTGTHRLDRLSSGEKSLVHLFLRLGSHMTQHTIVIIDELEAHLHPRWQHALFKSLKEFASSNSGITILSSTHSTDILHTFSESIDIPENGLIKGGTIIDKGLK